MKALTLWEPWASLIAMNKKKIETRSWKAPDNLIGERIAIHAATKMHILGKIMCREFSKLLDIVPYTGSWLYYLEYSVGPFGKIVATAKLVDCVEITDENEVMEYATIGYGEKQNIVDGNEYHFGDYTPGRYAWILDDIQRLDVPIPAKGKQRLWNWYGNL
jgi:hypothetical protein